MFPQELKPTNDEERQAFFILRVIFFGLLLLWAAWAFIPIKADTLVIDKWYTGADVSPTFSTLSQHFPGADIGDIVKLEVRNITNTAGGTIAADIKCASGSNTPADAAVTFDPSDPTITHTFTWSVPVGTPDSDDCYFTLSSNNNGGGLYAESTAVDTGYGLGINQTTVNNTYHIPFKLYESDATANDLAITEQAFNPATKGVFLAGTCTRYGSGIQQMSLYADANPDPNGIWNAQNGGLVDCKPDNTWTAYYIGLGMVATHTLFIDDSLYHATWTPYAVSVDQDFSATTTSLDWTGSVGYMSHDDPDGTAHRLACTDDEWADSNWWTQIRCGSSYLLWRSFLGIRNQMTDTIAGTENLLKSVFPFSIPANLISSWSESATAELPSSLDWLNPQDGNGDVALEMPAWITGGATSSVPVWGPAIFGTAGNPVRDTLSHIRAFTTYINWILFIYALFKIGQNLYDEIGWFRTVEKHDKNNYQL